MSTMRVGSRNHRRQLWWVALVLAVLAALGGCGGGGNGAAVRPPIPVGVPAAPASLDRADVNAWLDGLLPAALNSYGIAGAGVTVVHDGRVLTTRGYGRADTGTGDTPARPVDPEQTLFRIGSISKTFTATAVMQLVEQGKVDLDADVNTYLDFRATEPKGRITVRNLLTHTAGFEEQARSVLEPPGTNLDLRTFVTDQPAQVFVPGTVPAYSNYGNSLAGYVVQRVSGQPYAQYVREHVFEPTGMTSSSLEQPLRPDLVSRLSQGYPDDSKPAGPFEMVTASPAGAVSATPADMGRYLLAQLGELPASHSLIKPQTLAQMHSPALGADTLGTFAQGPRMTLGFFDDDRNGHRILGHLGDTALFHSSMELYPDDRTGIFVTLNSAGREPVDSSVLRDAVTSGFAERYFPGPDRALTPAPTAVAHAAQAAGTYESSRVPRTNFASVLRLYGQTVVTPRSDGSIVITPAPAGSAPVAYVEVAPWVWHEVGGPQVITMRTSGDRVEAIAYFSAFTLLRTDVAHTSTVALGMLVPSLVVLLLGALGWPLGALLRRRYRATAPLPAGPRWALVGTRIGVVAALAATLAWIAVLIAILRNGGLPDALLLTLQVVQLVGVLGVVPAAVHAVALVRHGVRRTRVVGGLLVLLGLVGVGWFAFVYHLVGFTTSY